MLRRVLQCCRKKRQIRIIYLTGPENNYDTLTGKTLLVSEVERLGRELAKLYEIGIKIIRAPYLYSEQYEKDFLKILYLMKFPGVGHWYFRKRKSSSCFF